MLSFIFLILGFVLLVQGASYFVEGASALARRAGISPLVVGLTVVALGTSAPELAVSITAGLQDANEIAMGNVLGSNLFNLLVVAGASALLCPQIVDKMLLYRDWPASILAVILLGSMILWDSQLSRRDGLVLCFFFVLILTLQIASALRNRRTRREMTILTPEEKQGERPLNICLNLLIGGLFIVMGGDATVDSATALAYGLGLSQTVIGLTMVALGTSLPELVTSVTAACRGEKDMAMGNVIGSNLFNILLILGVSSSIHPIPILHTSILDLAILLAVSLVLYLFALRGKLGRLVGGLSLAAYGLYMAYILVR